ncbi:hypothetical protein PRK78_002199 [Emydomyces testavorans]|uniref:non-specific serine/threonine protein kinase n=1 Tax=Emydomyces testavorans TaxID=2070801 RepID=A0AAF0DEE7_9EURO|nr:hypothetical protein PRK78_002199 [Emydomyces testavorans]
MSIRDAEDLFLSSLTAAKASDLKGVGCGSFSDVFLIPKTQFVIKIPYDKLEENVEREIYARLGPHPNILQCYGEFECILGRGIVLDYLPAGPLAQYIALEHFPSQRTHWPAQAIEATSYIHSKGVIHCDIGTHNFLLRNDGSIVLADFYGSILDGSPAGVSTAARYSRPLSLKQRLLNQTEKDDIFALGSVLYEIVSGHRLYEGKEDGEIFKLFQQRQFPDTSAISGPLRLVIEKCWRDQYESAEDVKSEFGVFTYLYSSKRREDKEVRRENIGKA